MSAYAVPGYLFPPLPSSFDAIGQSSNVSIADRPLSSLGKIDASPSRAMCSEERNGIQITVQDTKIDAVSLLQSFLSFSKSNVSMEGSSSRPKPYSRRRATRSNYTSRSVTASADEPTVSRHSVAKPQHEEEGCMMFTLRMVLGSIEDRPEFNSDGWKSPRLVTRTLAQIRQLYSDIVLELEGIEEPFHCSPKSSVPDIPLPPIHGGAPQDSQQHLPSFTYLQEQIRSYVPVLNHWFHQLVQKVPLMRSSVFMNFIAPTEEASTRVHAVPLLQWSPDPWIEAPNGDDEVQFYRGPCQRPIGKPRVGRMTRRIDSMESIDEGRCEEDEMD